MDARYSRQLVLPGFGAQAQQRLEQARVLVIGAGGLGSHVLPALAAAGVGTIGIVDDDTVELSNLPRQLVHGTEDVGTPKARSAAASIHRLNSTAVVLHEQRLTADAALPLFGQYDLVVDGSDNFPTRYLVADAAALTGIPLVWGAVSQYGGQASVALPGGPGYRDLFPTPPPPGSVDSCEVGGVLPTTVGIIGAVLATEAIKVLTGVGTPLSGRVTTYDALTGSFRELAFARSSEPVTELVDYEAFCGVSPRSSTITAAELSVSTGLTLIDVRETWEAEIAALPDALVIPLGTLPDVVASLDPSGQYVVYCHHGIRSQQGLAILDAAGLSARHLEGGIDSWARTVDPQMTRY
jgi:sulfur-carrier protein adenylyltransferase/sulfurtransferase